MNNSIDVILAPDSKKRQSCVAEKRSVQTKNCCQKELLQGRSTTTAEINKARADNEATCLLCVSRHSAVPLGHDPQIRGHSSRQHFAQNTHCKNKELKVWLMGETPPILGLLHFYRFVSHDITLLYPSMCHRGVSWHHSGEQRASGYNYCGRLLLTDHMADRYY